MFPLPSRPSPRLACSSAHPACHPLQMLKKSILAFLLFHGEGLNRKGKHSVGIRLHALPVQWLGNDGSAEMPTPFDWLFSWSGFNCDHDSSSRVLPQCWHSE